MKGNVPKNVVQGDVLALKIGMGDETGDAERRCQQSNLNGYDRDDTEPDQIRLGNDFEREWHDDQHDRQGIEKASHDNHKQKISR